MTTKNNISGLEEIVCYRRTRGVEVESRRYLKACGFCRKTMLRYEWLVGGTGSSREGVCVWGGGSERGSGWWRWWITHSLQMMCCPAHISMNASLSHYLYIMATTPRRGQASSRLISPLTARRPKEEREARRRRSPANPSPLLNTAAPDRLQNTRCGFLFHTCTDTAGKTYS